MLLLVSTSHSKPALCTSECAGAGRGRAGTGGRLGSGERGQAAGRDVVIAVTERNGKLGSGRGRATCGAGAMHSKLYYSDLQYAVLCGAGAMPLDTLRPRCTQRPLQSCRAAAAEVPRGRCRVAARPLPSCRAGARGSGLAWWSAAVWSGRLGAGDLSRGVGSDASCWRIGTGDRSGAARTHPALKSARPSSSKSARHGLHVLRASTNNVPLPRAITAVATPSAPFHAAARQRCRALPR